MPKKALRPTMKNAKVGSLAGRQRHNKRCRLYVIIGYDWFPQWTGACLVGIEAKSYAWTHPTRSTMALIVCVSFIALVKTEVRIRYCVAQRATEAALTKEWRTLSTRKGFEQHE